MVIPVLVTVILVDTGIIPIRLIRIIVKVPLLIILAVLMLKMIMTVKIIKIPTVNIRNGNNQGCCEGFRDLRFEGSCCSSVVYGGSLNISSRAPVRVP